MSSEFPFGMDAMNPLLEALGLPLDSDDRHYAYQGLTIHVTHNEYPYIEIRIAPDSEFWNDPAVKELISQLPRVFKEDR